MGIEDRGEENGNKENEKQDGENKKDRFGGNFGVQRMEIITENEMNSVSEEGTGAEETESEEEDEENGEEE